MPLCAALVCLRYEAKPLEASKRFDEIQVVPRIHPEKAVPLKASDRSSAYEDREIPELIAISKPNVRIAEQASADGPRIDCERGKLRPRRNELRWRRGRRLKAGRSWRH